MDANQFTTKSKYISTKNIEQYKNKVLIIKGATPEIVGDNEKLVIYFDNVQEKLVLNQTNLKVVIIAYGTDTDAWRMKEIKVQAIPSSFNGSPTQSVLVVI